MFGRATIRLGIGPHSSNIGTVGNNRLLLPDFHSLSIGAGVFLSC